MALLYAGARLGPVRGLVREAPHVLIEPVCVERLGALLEEPTASALRRRLARHHGANTEALFQGWTEV